MSESKTSGLWPALLQVQGELGAIGKDAQADSGTRHRYASLGAVLDVVRPALWRSGCVLTQTTIAKPEVGLVDVVTRIVHADTGESVECAVAVAPTTPTRKDGTPVLTEPQQVGVAISYARRYGVLCILGLATDDTDGVPPARVSSLPNGPADSVADTPDDALAPRIAALKALGQRIEGGSAEVKRRLAIVANTETGAGGFDKHAIARELPGFLLKGETTARRGLSDMEFAELITVLGEWPAEL